MPEAPHEPSPGRPRRHRTRQREEILAYLRASDAHPTAADLHAALAPALPGLSLGTVYRNLEVLVAEGEIDAVPGARGAARYDGNPAPHHHFVCDQCGAIHDVELRVPPRLRRSLEDDHGLRARRVRIEFRGSCPECESHASDPTSP